MIKVIKQEASSTVDDLITYYIVGSGYEAHINGTQIHVCDLVAEYGDLSAWATVCKIATEKRLPKAAVLAARAYYDRTRGEV